MTLKRFFLFTLILLAFGASHIVNASSDRSSVMGWKNNVYGVADVWGLHYNEPWTCSSHRVYIENAQEVTIKYTYEFNHSLLDLNGLRVTDDTIEREGKIKKTADGGQPVWINSGRGLNLNNEYAIRIKLLHPTQCPGKVQP